MSCTLEPVIQSGDTGQQMAFLDSCQLIITYSSISMSTIKLNTSWPGLFSSMHGCAKVRLQGCQAIFTWPGMRDQTDFWFVLYRLIKVVISDKNKQFQRISQCARVYSEFSTNYEKINFQAGYGRPCSVDFRFNFRLNQNF